VDILSSFQKLFSLSKIVVVSTSRCFHGPERASAMAFGSNWPSKSHNRAGNSSLLRLQMANATCEVVMYLGLQ